jgi:pimeloyl-[acyl-carrier protein] methyl ester esterase
MNAVTMESLHMEHRAPAAAGASRQLGVPIVLLHGWGMNLRVFDALRDDLAAEETWAVDLPGHGRSPWWPAAATFDEQVRAVLAILPPRCVLLGWSFGAKLAMAIAAAQPRRVAAAILIAASPKFAQDASWPHGMAAEALRAFDTVLAQDWQQTLQDFIALQLRGSRHAEESRQMIESALAVHGAPQRAALLAGMQLLETVDLRGIAATITQPVLLIAGQHDRVTPTSAARWLAQAMPHATLVEIARAGHAPMVSHHAEVAASIRQFLATLPPGAAS